MLGMQRVLMSEEKPLPKIKPRVVECSEIIELVEELQNPKLSGMVIDYSLPMGARSAIWNEIRKALPDEGDRFLLRGDLALKLGRLDGIEHLGERGAGLVAHLDQIMAGQERRRVDVLLPELGDLPLAELPGGQVAVAGDAVQTMQFEVFLELRLPQEALQRAVAHLFAGHETHVLSDELDDLVTLVLDVDPNETPDNLQAYAAQHGFEWIYVVAPREVAREIGQLYGDQFLNPPSTPMLIVDRHGEVHLLPFGRKSAEDLQEALKPFLSEEM